jgi:hypothetical protein
MNISFILSLYYPQYNESYAAAEFFVAVGYNHHSPPTVTCWWSLLSICSVVFHGVGLSFHVHCSVFKYFKIYQEARYSPPNCCLVHYVQTKEAPLSSPTPCKKQLQRRPLQLSALSLTYTSYITPYPNSPSCLLRYIHKKILSLLNPPSPVIWYRPSLAP